MAAFALKRYQGQALDALDNYLRAARLTGARAAFESDPLTARWRDADAPHAQGVSVILVLPISAPKSVVPPKAVLSRLRMLPAWSTRLSS